MTLALIITEPFLLATALWFVNVRDRAHQSEMRAERDAHRAEVQTLLQRIQAPSAAIAEYVEKGIEPMSQYPRSDEQMVTAQTLDEDAQAAIEQIRRMEQENVLESVLR